LLLLLAIVLGPPVLIGLDQMEAGRKQLQPGREQPWLEDLAQFTTGASQSLAMHHRLMIVPLALALIDLMRRMAGQQAARSFRDGEPQTHS
jgi:hypothetical protein